MHINYANKKEHPLRHALMFAVSVILLAAAILFIAYTTGGIRRFLTSSASGGKATYPLIIIDAGHGGEDGGAVGVNGVYEKDLNLEISQILADMLRANSVPVLMTRTEDILLYDRNVDYEGRKKVLDLRHRLKVCTDNPGSVLISIHMNTFPIAKYSGLQVYYSKNNPSSGVLAKTIQNDVQKLLQPDNTRKIKPANSSIFLLHENQNIAVLVECGFLSNPIECEQLSTPEYRQKLALVLFYSIMEFLEGQKGADS